MKILITGAAGFIGSNFLYYMLEKYKDYEFIALDNLGYAGNLMTIENALKKENVRFVKIDILDQEKINSLFKEEKFDFVVNFAAESHVDRSIIDPSIFLKVNIIGVQCLLDASLKYGVKRFHQVSTDEVYGDLPVDRPDLMFTESTPLNPSSPYSCSKASADMLVMAYKRTFNLPVTISRCSNNYGPYQFPEKLIPLVIQRVLLEKEVPVYGTGENVRDWLYVKDHCIAIDLILNNAQDGSVYNVGGNNEEKNINIVKNIIKILGKCEKLITYVTDRKGHDMRYAIDNTKIVNDLGFKPSLSFEEGLNLTVKWYLNNKAWLNDIINGDYKNYYAKMYNK